jgi:hypothetical protein
VLRNNGGWTNWHMEIINFFNCRDHYEARQKEQEYFVLLNATLNSIEPFPIPKIKNRVIKNESIKQEFYCIKCNINCKNANLLEFHNSTKKHIKNHIYETTHVEKYTCEICRFKCSKKGDWNRHLITGKHKRMHTMINDDNNLYYKDYMCDICNKKYNSRNGLWIHKKKCINVMETQKIDNKPDIVELLITENKEFKNVILDLIKNNQDFQKQMFLLIKV